MQKKLDELDKEEEKILNSVVESLVHSMLAKGDISEEDLSDREHLLKKLKNLTKNAKFAFVIDHRESILNTANEFFKNEKYDFSIIFFAMYFEHSINHIISHDLEKKKISKKTKMELIKSVNIYGKFTWLLEVLGLPKFNLKHITIINKAASERNAFIHYKWNPDPDIERNNEEQTNISLVNELRKSVTYFKKYESRVLYENKKGKLQNALNKKT